MTPSRPWNVEVLRLHRAAREPAARVGGEEALGPWGCAGTPSHGRWQRQAGRVSPWGRDGRHLTPGSWSRRARVGGWRQQGSGREWGAGLGPVWVLSEVAWVLCHSPALSGARTLLPSEGGRVWAAVGAAGPREASPPRPQPRREAGKQRAGPEAPVSQRLPSELMPPGPGPLCSPGVPVGMSSCRPAAV